MVRVLAIAVLLSIATQLLAQNEQKAATTKDAKPHPGLTDPKKASEKAPEEFKVALATTSGELEITVVRKWSPYGADRFYNLVRIGYFDDIAIFRAIKGFMFQFGIHGDPKISRVWSEANIKDDPNAGISNKKGFITFAKSGRPNSRSTQFFVNLGDNGGLDSQGFTPFGRVTKGMEVLEKINTEYGENPRDVQGNFQVRGNEYIKERFPKIDFIKSAKLVGEKKE